MKQTITQYDFLRAFQEWTANDRHLQFSREALLEIFDILTEWEEGTGEEIELDVVGICCDFTEYEDIDEACEVYGINLPDHDDDSKIEALSYNLMVYEIFNTGRILVQG